MQTKQLLLFAAIAVLGGAIFSMVTSGTLAAQTNSNNYNADAASNGSLIDSILAGNGMTDEEDEEDDEDECDEDDEAISNGTSGISGEDTDEAGDTEVNDEEDEDEEEDDEDESAEDEAESGSSTTTAGNNGTTGTDEEEDDENMAFEPCVFSSEIDNPYLPLSKYMNKTLTFAGNSTEDGQLVPVKEVWSVLENTTEIADVETLTVMVREYEGDVLTQEALQYYAQGMDGVVYFFGEDVVDYENGVAVENDEESWEVGDDAAAPGIAMPATPTPGIGFAYHSVSVPGIAHELSEVKSLNETVSVEYGSFPAIEVTDYDFDDGTTSQEFYASGVGLIKESEDEEQMELISIS